VTRERRGGLLSFGFLAALWAASTGMYAIMQQLNITYRVKEARSFVRARAVALGLTLLFGLLVVGSLSLIVTGGALQEWIGNRFGTSEALLMAFSVFRWVMIVLALLLAFALIYYLAPNVEQRFVFITPGSVLATVLLVIASLGFSLYASRFGNYDATYGSIGAVILLMLWLYIAGLVILVGSEINVLVETYAPEGKVKGERVEGEATATTCIRSIARPMACVPMGVRVTPRRWPPSAVRAERRHDAVQRSRSAPACASRTRIAVALRRSPSAQRRSGRRLYAAGSPSWARRAARGATPRCRPARTTRPGRQPAGRA
jgi:YihY family inner membrane protein